MLYLAQYFIVHNITKMSDQELAKRFELSEYLVGRPDDCSNDVNDAQRIRIASHIEIHERISGVIIKKFFTSLFV